MTKELYWGRLVDERDILSGLFDERAILGGGVGLFDERVTVRV